MSARSGGCGTSFLGKGNGGTAVIYIKNVDFQTGTFDSLIPLANGISSNWVTKLNRSGTDTPKSSKVLFIFMYQKRSRAAWMGGIERHERGAHRGDMQGDGMGCVCNNKEYCRIRHESLILF